MHVGSTISQRTKANSMNSRIAGPACAVGITHDGARTADRLQDDYSSDVPAHFLRILSMAFPLASSSTSLSK